MAADWGRHRTRREAFAIVGILLVTGCSTGQASQRPGTDVAVLRIDAPVSEPVWSHDREAVLALVEEEPRIAKIEPRSSGGRVTASSTLSAHLTEVGENIETSPTQHDVVYVPQPKAGRVAIVGIEDLRQRGTLRAGPEPSYVVKDAGSTSLLALSEDGATVTGVDLRHSRTVSRNDVSAGPEAKLDGPKRGRLVSYHVAGPKGISHYKGPPDGVSEKGHLGIEVEDSSGDLVKVSRVYIAEKGTDRLLAVDSHRWHHGMQIVAETRLGEPVRHIGVDETRIYAATEHELVVLETNSFEGFENNRFTVVDTIDYRSALPSEALKKAPLSGIAVGTDRVYLTVKGEPYMVAVTKAAV